jgi:hypothetical protein
MAHPELYAWGKKGRNYIYRENEFWKVNYFVA